MRKSFLQDIAGKTAVTAAALGLIASLAGCGGQQTQVEQQTTTTTQTTQSAPPEQTSNIPRGALLKQAPSAPEQQQSSQGSLVSTPSGLQYQDLVVGKGAQPRAGQTVTVHYNGYLTNGSKFDSSVDKGQPFQFVLGQGEVIRGWDEGVSTMRVGGMRKLVVPPNLGYGDRGAGGVIPPNATLVFDVELLGAQ
jgi:peptidylprolyl isomerase